MPQQCIIFATAPESNENDLGLEDCYICPKKVFACNNVKTEVISADTERQLRASFWI